MLGATIPARNVAAATTGPESPAVSAPPTTSAVTPVSVAAAPAKAARVPNLLIRLLIPAKAPAPRPDAPNTERILRPDFPILSAAIVSALANCFTASLASFEVSKVCVSCAFHLLNKSAPSINPLDIAGAAAASVPS